MLVKFAVGILPLIASCMFAVFALAGEHSTVSSQQAEEQTDHDKLISQWKQRVARAEAEVALNIAVLSNKSKSVTGNRDPFLCMLAEEQAEHNVRGWHGPTLVQKHSEMVKDHYQEAMEEIVVETFGVEKDTLVGHAEACVKMFNQSPRTKELMDAKHKRFCYAMIIVSAPNGNMAECVGMFANEKPTESKIKK